MTNSIIPYSFVPGTKAKAQEVNANFIALAEQITENHTNTTEKISELNQTLSDRIETVETSIVENAAKNDLSNTDSITNSILEAPNGVAVYDNCTVTVKSGVRVLIPNGRTDNNKLKNIDYTTEADISKTATNFNNATTAVFLFDNGTLELVDQKFVFYKNATPTTLTQDVYWYKIDENIWYKYVFTQSAWVVISAIPVAKVTWNANNTIASIIPIRPVNLLKESDLNDAYTLKGILPVEMDYVVETWNSGNNFYRVYKSGWVKQGGYVNGKGDTYVSYFKQMAGLTYTCFVTRISDNSNTTNYNVWIRNAQVNYMKIYAQADTGKMWCVEGFMASREEV